MPVTPAYTTPTNVTAGEGDSGKFNTEIVDSIQHLFLRGPYKCTAATRPAGPSEGDFIYETDTDTVYVYDGTTWRQITKLGQWTTYTPTDANITVGAGGTRSARYRLIDPKTCAFKWSFVLGTGSIIGTGAAVGLPFPAAAELQMVPAYLLDASARNYLGAAKIAASGTVGVLIHTESGGSGGVTANDPYVWTGVGGDSIVVQGVYEIA